MTKSNFEIIKDHYKGSDDKNLSAMLAPLSSNTQWTEMAGFPCAGVYTGPEEVVENVFKRLEKDWDGYTFKLERLIDAGDSVVGVGTYYATYKETGKSMEARVTHVWDLKEGKVVRFEQFTDTLLVSLAMQK